VPPGDFSRSAVEAQWERRESDSGRTLDIGHSFYPFEKDFPTWREEFHIAQGRVPLISWNGTDTLAVASGLHDELIADRARRVADLDVPVLIRWFWEMDASFKLERARDPASYAAALERIQGIFAAEGADQVEWVWCPTAFEWEQRGTADWYPGDGLVDWVCADGYNFAPTKPGAEWRDFETIFSGFYDWAAATGKPIMIGEFGAQERAAGDKAAWIEDIRSTVPERFPLIRALVYFDVDRTELEGYDWTLETSDDAYEAFLSLVNDPYFVTRGP
jgi:Glycosyl hydrolase family 26